MNPLPQGQPVQMPEIQDIAPPIYVFPYPYWMVALAVAGLLAAVIGAAWLIRRYLKNRPAPAPPTPREIALRAFEKARNQVEREEPYSFSILVSDILRTYIAAQFSLPATQQTSQEFLSALGRFHGFSEPEKALLAAFLDKCDLVKFARIASNSKDNALLLQEAVRFVKGANA